MTNKTLVLLAIVLAALLCQGCISLLHETKTLEGNKGVDDAMAIDLFAGGIGDIVIGFLSGNTVGAKIAYSIVLGVADIAFAGR